MQEQDPGRNLHHDVRAQTESEEALGEGRAQRGARRRAHGYQREQSISIGAGIDLVRVGPELGDRREAENAHPHKKDEAQMRNPDPATKVEELDATYEKKNHHPEKLLPRETSRQPAIEWDVGDEGQGLGGSGVGLELGAAGHENKRFADSLQDVVGDEQEEYVERH